MSDIAISVVIPCYNEESNLPELYDRLNKTLQSMNTSYEIIMVNDGSRDKSLLMMKAYAAKDPNFKYIDLSRNFGHQIAIFTGVDQSCGQDVLIMDGDLQDQPELIPDMQKMLHQGYDVVYAKRKTRKGVSMFKKFCYKTFYKILGRITEVDIPLDTGDFRIMTRQITDLLCSMPEQPKFLRGQIAWLGFKQGMYEYDRDERKGGDPGYTYSMLIRLAMDGITQFSDLPLKAATALGFTASGIGFAIGIYSIIARFISDNYIQGWASTMTAILFIGGIQLVTIGVIGEYISRMSTNIKNRPTYIIRESNIDSKQ